jgi:hypothetical protein
MHVTLNQPYFVGSLTSGVDGASEGGRLSTIRLPSVLVLYSVPLLQELKRRGYRGKVTAEPAQVDGRWVIKLVYEGDPPTDVPELWHGHRVVVEPASHDEPEATKRG